MMYPQEPVLAETLSPPSNVAMYPVSVEVKEGKIGTIVGILRRAKAFEGHK